MSTDKTLRIVVKVGSNVLTRHDGTPNVTNMSGIVDQIAALRAEGHSVILVSSGAVACGRSVLKPQHKLDDVQQRQLFSSIGQVHLINIYSRLFGYHDMVVGQVLTQKENFNSRTSYLNQRECMLTMLQNDVIPIVNENDTASLTELMFTDNDELSGLIAAMLDADALVILSNVDGIYTGNPGDPASELIRVVEPDDDLSGNIVAVKSGFGRGGMGTKCNIAGKLAKEGVAVYIARGNRADILVDLIHNPEKVPHTFFRPVKGGVSTIKRWIAHSQSFSKGRITVDAQAARMLRADSAVSLLPIGITATDGDWEDGDIVTLVDPDGTTIGVGRAAIDSATTAATMGRHGARAVIHYDYLYIPKENLL